MASDETVELCLGTIAETIGIEREDFDEADTWKFLGLGERLAAATVADLNRLSVGVHVPVDAFTKYPTVGEWMGFLRQAISNAKEASLSNAKEASRSTDVWRGIPPPKVPLSVVLQGQPDASSVTVFLFPDGSGAGTSYASLPPIGSHVCVVGLNSPFLRQAQAFTCSIERMAGLWLDQVRSMQPKGQPFVLGGWSAGGYYAFEVAKLLTAAGEKVDRLILIDSPCRVEFEALPEQVVAELTRKGLMGASGGKKAPDWLVQHFTSTVIAVDKYMPTPFSPAHVPTQVHFIWVKEGLVESVAASGLEVDLNVKVTRFLLEPRANLETAGWETLLPAGQYTFDYMTGNHFQITQPPHSRSLGELLRKLVAK